MVMRSLVIVAALLGLFIAAETKSLLVCPNGMSQVYCFVDPCQVSKCTGQPMATCSSDYCGGCNANWYLPNGVQLHSADCGSTAA